jgi:hypothetical protein
MNRCLRLVLSLCSCFALSAPALLAQGRIDVRPELGVYGGRQFKDDFWIAGGYFRMPLVGALDFRPSGDVALSEPHDYQLNGDLALHGPRDLAYLGAGYAWVHHDFAGSKESASGANIFIGFKPFPSLGAQLHLEGRWTLAESRSIFRLMLGASWRL